MELKIDKSFIELNYSQESYFYLLSFYLIDFHGHESETHYRYSNEQLH